MSKKLLLADDSVTIQRVIELTFSGEDIQVIPVGDGEAAIARIPIDKPDIVLADIGMPKRSGYEVCAFVKNHPDFKGTPVLLLAGAFEPVDDAKAKEVGCDGVLVKPFEPQHVIARVRELIGGATGSPTQSAVQDIPRPAARLAPSRPVELPKRDDRPEMPEDLMEEVAESDLGPRVEMMMEEPEDAQATSTIILDDSLDDYFDKLDEAFGNVAGPAQTNAASPRVDARPARPDRPVLERDLESFDEPSLMDDSATQYADAPRVADADPFAGMTELEPENGISVPTLDDLLGSMERMDGMANASEHAPISFGSASNEAAVQEITFEAPPAPMIFDTPAPAVILETPEPAAVAMIVETPAPSMIFEAQPVAEMPAASEPAVELPPQPIESPAAFVAQPIVVELAPSVVEGLALSEVEGPDVTASLAAAIPQPVPVAPVAPPPPVRPDSGRSIIADAFSALLAAEQGDSSAHLVRLGGNGGNGTHAPAAAVVTDAMVDDVARRVIEKLALGSSDQMNAIVKQIVSDVSERLVREEIERIRHTSGQ